MPISLQFSKQKLFWEIITCNEDGNIKVKKLISHLGKFLFTHKLACILFDMLVSEVF